MWYNGMMKWLLRSRLHGTISKQMLLMSYEGRRSGKRYTLPVSYFTLTEEGEGVLYTTSTRARTWWRNLRGGAGVHLLLRGEEVAGRAEAMEEERQVREVLGAYLREHPRYARYFGVALDAEGQPEAEGLAAAARARVVVRTRIGG